MCVAQNVTPQQLRVRGGDFWGLQNVTPNVTPEGLVVMPEHSEYSSFDTKKATFGVIGVTKVRVTFDPP